MSGKSKRSRQAGASSPGQQQSRLVFPINDIHTRLRNYYSQQQQNGLGITNISNNASIYLTAVLEYLTAEILELAGDRSHEVDASRIRVSHIRHAIRNEEEWSKVNLADVAIDDEMDDEEVEEEQQNLPIALLPKVATYLPCTSCLSLLMAMAPQSITSQHVPSAAVKAIAASCEDWDNIEFKDVQDMIGRSLADDDVRWVLIAIDGVNKIKSLKLTHCFGITGAGLSPLRGSRVLESIDLSRGNTSDTLSEEEVVSILSSVLDRKDNSLSYVGFPCQWRKDWSDVLSSFLERFNDALMIRIHEDDRDDFLCEDCGERYVEGCIDVWQCSQCETKTCEGCGNYCEKCESVFCSSCGLSYCDHCETGFCSHCSLKCESCSKVSCEACDDEHKEGIEMCDFECGGLEGGGCGDGERGGISRCLDCRVKRVERRGDSSCPGCAQIIAPLLINKVNKLQRSNKKLKRRIEQMEG